ncbi:hypothetical protein BH10PSE7_BH10PSE7_35210 [soil metagenome]
MLTETPPALLDQESRDPRPPGWAAVAERLWANKNPEGHTLAGLAYSGTVIEGRDCWVYRAAAPAIPFSLAVKLYKPRASRPFPIRLQMQRHRLCAKKMAGTGGYTVPQPVAGFPPRQIVVMEWIDGPSARDLMRTVILKRDAYRELLVRAGRWLGCFHGVSKPKTEALPVERLIEGLDRRVLKSHPHIGNDPVYAAADRTIRELAPLLDGREMEQVEVHGDFTPSNLLIDRDRTIGIDFGATRRLPHYYDICRFLVHLEAQRPAPKWLGARPQNFAAEAFLEGYGDHAPPASGDIMNYMMLIEVLRRWAAVGVANGSIPARLLRSIETRRLRAMAVGLTKALA